MTKRPHFPFKIHHLCWNIYGFEILTHWFHFSCNTSRACLSYRLWCFTGCDCHRVEHYGVCWTTNLLLRIISVFTGILVMFAVGVLRISSEARYAPSVLFNIREHNFHRFCFLVKFLVVGWTEVSVIFQAWLNSEQVCELRTIIWVYHLQDAVSCKLLFACRYKHSWRRCFLILSAWSTWNSSLL